MTPRWHGRAGVVVLGPTEHRVARYLDDVTRHGWIRIRTADVAARCQLGRSEAFRILARLQALGLFGISRDRGGHAGGRRVWRTAAQRGGRLDPGRHRVAWARVVGAGKHARALAMARVASRRAPAASGAPSYAGPEGVPPSGPRRFPLADWLLREAPALASEWRVT